MQFSSVKCMHIIVQPIATIPIILQNALYTMKQFPTPSFLHSLASTLLQVESYSTCLSWLAYFTEHNTFKVHPHCCTYQNFLPFYLNSISLYVCTTLSIHPSRDMWVACTSFYFFNVASTTFKIAREPCVSGLCDISIGQCCSEPFSLPRCPFLLTPIFRPLLLSPSPPFPFPWDLS